MRSRSTRSSCSTSGPAPETWTWTPPCQAGCRPGSSLSKPLRRALRATSPPSGEETKASAQVLGALEEGLHLDRESHVALDLQLALHERGRSVELAERHLHVVLRVHVDGEVRVIRLTFARFGLAIVDLHPPLATLVTAEVKLDGRVRAARARLVQRRRHLIENHVRGDLVRVDLSHSHPSYRPPRQWLGWSD